MDLHRNRRRLTPSLLLVITALGLIPTPEVFADPGGLDLVVLVDQSGSMLGHGIPVKNDPYNVRNLMVTFTLDLMAKNAVLNQVTHRLGVISFGTTVRVDLPLSELSTDNIEKLRDSVKTIPAKESLEYTNFLAAFQAAAKMFASLPQRSERRRAIILITDGAPYVDEIPIHEYTKELRRFAAAHFPHPEYQILVVALNNPTSDYWDRYRGLWRDVSHNQARKLEGDENDIFAALHEVVTELVQTRVIPVVEEEIVIPPYLESMVFDIFSVDPGVRVGIYSPEDPNTPLTPDSDGVEVVSIGEIIKTFTVRRPTPGLWMVRKSDSQARVDVFNQQFFPRGELVQPAPQELRQYETVSVAYRVVDGTGQPIRELAGYPLKLELSLVKPDDSRLRLDMERAPELGEAVFRTVGETECDLPGRYRAEVLVATKDLNDQQVTVFQDGWSGFVVRAALRLECRIEAPRAGERLPLYGPVVFWPRPVATRFAFVDENEQPVNLAAILSGSPSELVELSLVRGNGELAPAVELRDLGGGILEGEIDGWLRPGEYRLRPRADRALVPEQYGVRFEPQEVPFSRHLTWLHWAQLVFLAAVVLSVVSVTGYHVWMNLLAPLRGTLYIDRLGSGQVAEYALNRRRQHRMTLKELPLETQLARIIVRARRGRPAIIVTAINTKKKVLLKERTLIDRGQTMLKGIPYILKYRA